MKPDGSVKRSVHRVSVQAEQALKAAVTNTIQEHARTGDPVVIWRHGKVVWVPAKTLLRQQSRRHQK